MVRDDVEGNDITYSVYLIYNPLLIYVSRNNYLQLVAACLDKHRDYIFYNTEACIRYHCIHDYSSVAEVEGYV